LIEGGSTPWSTSENASPSKVPRRYRIGDP
jgi:hypothetical protein